MRRGRGHPANILALAGYGESLFVVCHATKTNQLFPDSPRVSYANGLRFSPARSRCWATIRAQVCPIGAMPSGSHDHAREEFLAEAQELVEGLSRDLLVLDQDRRGGEPSPE